MKWNKKYIIVERLSRCQSSLQSQVEFLAHDKKLYQMYKKANGDYQYEKKNLCHECVLLW